MTRTDLRRAQSLRLDAGELHDLAPLLSFGGDELRKIRGRSHQRGSIEIGKPRLHRGLREAGVDLAIEPLDDLGGRLSRRADAEPGARLVGRHGLVDRGQSWEET